VSRHLLIFLFIAVFVTTLVARAPAGLALDLAGLDSAGLSHGRVAGTIWSGEVSRVNLRGQPLGRVTFEARPGAVLSGRIAYDVTVMGETGEARAVAFAGRERRGVENLVGDINVQALRRLDPRLRQVPSTVQLSIRELSFATKRDCRSADGGLRSDVLTRLGEAWQWEGPAMTGRVRCDGDTLLVELEGVDGDEAIRARLQVDPAQMRYSLRASVETSNPGVEAALRELEFTRSEGGAFVYTRANTPNATTPEETAS